MEGRQELNTVNKPETSSSARYRSQEGEFRLASVFVESGHGLRYSKL